MCLLQYKPNMEKRSQDIQNSLIFSKGNRGNKVSSLQSEWTNSMALQTNIQMKRKAKKQNERGSKDRGQFLLESQNQNTDAYEKKKGVKQKEHNYCSIRIVQKKGDINQLKQNIKMKNQNQKQKQKVNVRKMQLKNQQKLRTIKSNNKNNKNFRSADQICRKFQAPSVPTHKYLPLSKRESNHQKLMKPPVITYRTENYLRTEELNENPYGQTYCTSKKIPISPPKYFQKIISVERDSKNKQKRCTTHEDYFKMNSQRQWKEQKNKRGQLKTTTSGRGSQKSIHSSINKNGKISSSLKSEKGSLIQQKKKIINQKQREGQYYNNQVIFGERVYSNIEEQKSKKEQIFIEKVESQLQIGQEEIGINIILEESIIIRGMEQEKVLKSEMSKQTQSSRHLQGDTRIW